jgi:hypothetical protein
MPRQCSSFFSARSADSLTTQRCAASGWKPETPSSMAFSIIQSIFVPSGSACASVMANGSSASRGVCALISALALRRPISLRLAVYSPPSPLNSVIS